MLAHPHPRHPRGLSGHASSAMSMNQRLLLFLAAAACAAAQDPQRVEGFAKIVFAHNNHPSATVRTARDFRGPSPAYMTAGWWAPGQVRDNRLEWETAPCPEKRPTVFRFVGASSPLPPGISRGPELKLFVDGDFVLSFRIGLLRDWSWTGAPGFRLAYRPVRNEWVSWGRQRQFELEGNSGVYELSVPAERIAAGKPVTIKVEMQPFPRWPNGWFMVKDRRDTLAPGESELREQVAQLRADVNRLGELVHVLASSRERGLDARGGFEDFVIHSNGYRHLHPADLVPLRGGALLLTAREATEHVARDGDVIVLRSEDGGRAWSRLARIGLPDLDEREACGVELPDGSVVMAVFYNALYRPDGEYEQLWKKTVRLGAGKQYLGFYIVRSTDGGRTWSEPKFISTAGMPFSDTEGPADAPVLMPDGSLLLPLMAYNPGGDLANVPAVLLKSTDQGDSWRYLSTIAADPGGKLGGFAEPGLLQLGSGVLLAAMRNTTGNVWIAKSKDGGLTWSAPKPTPMVGHPADLARLADGRILCTYGIREPYHDTPSGVRAAFSRDEGETWDIANEVQIRSDFLNWDVGYPESRQMPDGRILTVYYFNLLGRYFLGGTIWKP